MHKSLDCMCVSLPVPTGEYILKDAEYLVSAVQQSIRVNVKKNTNLRFWEKSHNVMRIKL